ncbi:MAG: hypothetical protein ACJASQ_002196 [Crocinitomicaceae bacterium]|jgi:hypothetical protein
MKNQLKKSVLFALLLLIPTFIFSQTPPPLGVASSFVLFTSIGANTAAGSLSQITGNVGSNSAGGTSGFGNINGTIHTNNVTSALAAFDLDIAYTNLSNQIPDTTIGLLLGGGQTLMPNVYLVPGAGSLIDTLFLDGAGDTSACFVFQMNDAFSTTAGSVIKLINGTQTCNVFWKVNGAISMATNTTFKGTMISNGAIVLDIGVKLDGRALSIAGAVTVNGILVGNSGGIHTSGPLAPVLNAISCFSIYTSAGAVTNTGTTNVVGHIGTNNTTVSGFNPINVVGVIHSVPDLSTSQANLSLDTLYNYLNGLPYDIELSYPVLFGKSQVLTPNVYIMNAAATLTDTIFLDAMGNASAVFVIRIMGAFTTGPSPQVVLLGGADSENIFWQVEGAVTIANGSNFNGIIVANNGAIVLNTGVKLNGKALSTTGAITTANANIISTICSFPLPIELLSFTAESKNAHVELNWFTANEINNDYFDVERSFDGINFTSIDKINGAGNSTQVLSYSAVDDTPLTGISYYRLKQTDYDGKTSYSDLEAVEFNNRNDYSLDIYPNPFSVETSLHTNENLKEASLIIYNSNGQIVKQIENISGQTFTVNRDNLSRGLYFVNLVQNSEVLAASKLIITD